MASPILEGEAPPPRAADDEEELGSDDTDGESSSDDEDYVPQKRKRTTTTTTIKKKKKKKKKPKPPNLDELSLPKPAARLDPLISLGDAALVGCTFESAGALSSSSSSAKTSKSHSVLLEGRRPTRGQADDFRLADYKAIYSVQLPGMPFYYDAYHVAHTSDAALTDVLGGATFQLLRLHTTRIGAPILLLLDVLALAVDPKRARKGVGAALVANLKAIAKREAKAASSQLGGKDVRPLLLTQADLSCVGFWSKQGFARALDANALVRQLRRNSGHTIFDGATPMALLLPSK